MLRPGTPKVQGENCNRQTKENTSWGKANQKVFPDFSAPQIGQIKCQEIGGIR